MYRLLLVSFLLLIGIDSLYSQTPAITWGDSVLIHDEPVFKDKRITPEAGGTKGRKHGIYGSQYGRLLKMKNGEWLAGYTISDNPGYKNDMNGGLKLQIALSEDTCRTWKIIAEIADPGRDLDNAQLIQLSDGSILLACRSVRWQESYRLPVYKSKDEGKTWKKISVIDTNEGEPAELGNPDKGIYEPHMGFLADGRLSVFYANEKHVTEDPSYSQIISQKISGDEGRSWGPEEWVVFAENHNSSRPGMPVWTRMKDDKYILVYEICGPELCNIYYKISQDGKEWPKGFGTLIPGQLGGPYILSLNNGMLVVTSNKSQISISNDLGKTWNLVTPAWQKTLWPSMYEIDKNEIGVVNSVPRSVGGNNIQIRFGRVEDTQ